MKILVISGFLGAGKTTFIKTLVQRTDRRIAILENEYASVGMDGDILESSLSDGKINIWEMTEGCICCSGKGDFAASVLTIANTVDPEYLIIEPTGVGRLSNVLHNLQQIEYERITLLAPVTVVDGNSYYRYLKEYGELYRDQLAAARTIILSKMEHAGNEECRRLEEALRKWNSTASILTEHYSAMGKEWWDSLFTTGFHGEPAKTQEEDAGCLPETLSLRGVGMKTPEQLILILERLIRGQFGDIIRAKGCIPAGDQVLKFDVADGKYSVSGALGLKSGKVIFIGKGISKQLLRKQFSGKNSRILIRGTAGLVNKSRSDDSSPAM